MLRDALKRQRWDFGPDLMLGQKMVRSDGAFVVEDLPKGRCHVVASYGGGRAFVIEADVSTNTQDLVLRLAGNEPLVADMTGSIDLTLISPDPRRLIFDDSVVELGRPGWMVGGRMVAPGRFRFESLPLESMELKVTARPWRHEPPRELLLTAEKPHLDLVIHLRAGVNLRGRVASVEFSKMNNRAIRFVPESGPGVVGPIAASGAFEVAGLEPQAAYRIEMEAFEPPNEKRYWAVASPRPFRTGASDVTGIIVESLAGSAFTLGPLPEVELPSRVTLRVELSSGGSPLRMVVEVIERRVGPHQPLVVPAGPARFVLEADGQDLAALDVDVGTGSKSELSFRDSRTR